MPETIELPQGCPKVKSFSNFAPTEQKLPEMKKCRACQQPIADAAARCPHCGAAVIEETILCPACGEENSLYASACVSCGTRFFAGEPEPDTGIDDDIFGNASLDALQREVAKRFEAAFRKRLEEEHSPVLHARYYERLQQSGFQGNLNFRIEQLASEVSALGADFRTKAVKKLLERNFEELLDYFIIRFCADLNETNYPEAILRYHGKSLDQIDLRRMILDYLDLEVEDLSWYDDFVTMPAGKLRNAADNFLFPKKDEKLFLIVNTAILGNCKNGFAMTSKCLYWKTELEPAQRVFYHKLEEVKRDDKWITINGIFFHASTSIDLKMIRLLKRFGV